MDTPATSPEPLPPATTAGPVVPSAPAPGAAPVARYPAPAPAEPPHNVLAWVSLGLGLGFVVLGTIASIAAVICGHIARAQIRTRGEQGANAALWGLILGYAGIALTALALVALVVFLVVAVGVSGVANQRL